MLLAPAAEGELAKREQERVQVVVMAPSLKSPNQSRETSQEGKQRRSTHRNRVDIGSALYQGLDDLVVAQKRCIHQRRDVKAVTTGNVS